MVKEIPVEEFTAGQWSRLAQTADAKTRPPRPFNEEHFFPEVRNLMKAGMAMAWSNEEKNAFLVGLFHKNIFSGDPIALNLFWVSLEGRASLELLKEFEAEAARRGCVATYASAFRNYRTKGMARLFRKLGYEPHELGFVKMAKEN